MVRAFLLIHLFLTYHHQSISTSEALFLTDLHPVFSTDLPRPPSVREITSKDTVLVVKIDLPASNDPVKRKLLLFFQLFVFLPFSWKHHGLLANLCLFSHA